jgi:MerR family mercuric resistance operon transcriptional regulator
VRAEAERLTVGEVARGAGVRVETVRFYEREGLIDRPARTPSGYRQYDHGVVRRIRFIQHAKGLGFSLREIGELLSLRAAPDGTCAAVRARALAKIGDIDSRIASLGAMRRALVRLVEACAGGGPASECPFLEALDQENDHAVD